MYITLKVEGREGVAAGRDFVNPWEIRILKSVKRKPKRERSIAKSIKLNEAIVSEFVTNLMLKGYLERRRRRWMLFFSREYFVTTVEGLAALEAVESNIDRIIELVKESGQKVANEILMSLPPLARDTVTTTYKMAKFILR
jgi:DNA-binding MarR family transcriptional regulator